MRSSGASLPVVSVGIAAAGIGLYFLLRKRDEIPTHASTSVQAPSSPAQSQAERVLAPVSVAQESVDQSVVDQAFQSLQSQVPEEFAPIVSALPISDLSPDLQTFTPSFPSF